MSRFNEIFGFKKPIIGMIHVDALPGTPNYSGSMQRIIDKAMGEAEVYQSAGIDAIAIENMHDVPYLNGDVGAEIVSAMSVIGYEVKRTTNLPCGIQILAGANRQALAVALAANLDFIRAEGFAFAHIADEGLIQACAGELLRYRKYIGAEHIAVFTDIKKKHSSHAITADVEIVETAKAAEFFLSDGVVITGISTGNAAKLDDIERAKEAVEIPVLVGSGVTLENVETYLTIADGLIVGSYFKTDEMWQKPVNLERVKLFMDNVNNIRTLL